MAETREFPLAERKALLRERVQERLDFTKKTAHQVSKAIGANSGYVRDLLDPAKTAMPKEERARALAIELETTSDYLLARASSPEPVLSEVTLLDRQAGWNPAPREGRGIPLVGTGDCAELTVQMESGGEIEIELISFDPEYTVRYIERPLALVAEFDAYAIEFNGSSMEPRFFAGERGIALPSRHASPGSFVVVQINDGRSRDVTGVLVKRLVASNSRELVLEQYNPPMTFSIPRTRVVRMHPLYRPENLL